MYVPRSCLMIWRSRSLATLPTLPVTTRTGLIAGPLRDRFGLVERLDFYSADDLRAIVLIGGCKLSCGRHQGDGGAFGNLRHRLKLLLGLILSFRGGAGRQVDRTLID